MTSTILVVANETLGGRPLIESVRARAAKEDIKFVLCVPQNRPKAGLVIYDDAVFDAAQARVDLAVGFLRTEDIDVIGEVGDPDPYIATMDAVYEHKPTEIIISTHPETRSGWLGRDLIERVRNASRIPVQHVIADVDTEGIFVRLTLVVANRTASGDQLLDVLKSKVEADPEKERGRLFIVVVPQEGGDGAAARRARTRLKLVLDRIQAVGLFAAGTIGDPDPYTAIMNALQYFHIDDIVISTLPETKSGWLRADLIERVRRATGKQVEHVIQSDTEPATA
jgi:hypothetical protein